MRTIAKSRMGETNGMLDISDPLPGFCGRITDDPSDHTAARLPRSSEFRRLPGRRQGWEVMGG